MTDKCFKLQKSVVHSFRHCLSHPLCNLCLYLTAVQHLKKFQLHCISQPNFIPKKSLCSHLINVRLETLSPCVIVADWNRHCRGFTLADKCLSISPSFGFCFPLLLTHARQTDNATFICFWFTP